MLKLGQTKETVVRTINKIWPPLKASEICIILIPTICHFLGDNWNDLSLSPKSMNFSHSVCYISMSKTHCVKWTNNFQQKQKSLKLLFLPRNVFVEYEGGLIQSIPPSSAKTGPSSHMRSKPPTRFSFPVILLEGIQGGNKTWDNIILIGQIRGRNRQYWKHTKKQLFWWSFALITIHQGKPIKVSIINMQSIWYSKPKDFSLKNSWGIYNRLSLSTQGRNIHQLTVQNFRELQQSSNCNSWLTHRQLRFDQNRSSKEGPLYCVLKQDI